MIIFWIRQVFSLSRDPVRSEIFKILNFLNFEPSWFCSHFFKPGIHSLKMMNWYRSSLNHWNPLHIIICLQVHFDNMWPYYITESYKKRYFRWVWSFEGYFIWLKADENLLNSVLLTVLLKICSKLNITRGDKLVISKFRYLLRE